VTVGDRMTRRIATVAVDATLRQAAEEMCRHRVGSLLVLEGERLLGIVTERDVLKAVGGGDLDARVDDVMTAQPETIDATEPLEQAAVLMLHGGFRHLPVLEDGRVVGVLSMRDLMTVVAGDQAPRGV
jgi:CBS domain-containing protein